MCDWRGEESTAGGFSGAEPRFSEAHGQLLATWTSIRLDKRMRRDKSVRGVSAESFCIFEQLMIGIEKAGPYPGCRGSLKLLGALCQLFFASFSRSGTSRRKPGWPAPCDISLPYPKGQLVKPEILANARPPPPARVPVLFVLSSSSFHVCCPAMRLKQCLPPPSRIHLGLILVERFKKRWRRCLLFASFVDSWSISRRVAVLHWHE